MRRFRVYFRVIKNGVEADHEMLMPARNKEKAVREVKIHAQNSNRLWGKDKIIIDKTEEIFD